MKKNQGLLCTIVAGLALTAMQQTSYSQNLPFKASGSHAVFMPCTGQTKGIGNASIGGKDMGEVISYGLVIPTPTKNPLVYDWTAYNFVLRTENGDEISFIGSGTVEFVPLKEKSFGKTPLSKTPLYIAFWTADFHVAGGTGIFQNVSPGPRPLHAFAVNDALSLPFECPGDAWSYSWDLEGSIDMGQSKHPSKHKALKR